MTMGPERRGEDKFRQYVIEHGGLCIKLGGARGIPDRLVLTPNGKHYFVEFKAAAGRLTKAQIAWRDKLKSMGHTAKVHHSAAEAIEFYEQTLEATPVPTEGT